MKSERILTTRRLAPQAEGGRLELQDILNATKEHISRHTPVHVKPDKNGTLCMERIVSIGDARKNYILDGLTAEGVPPSKSGSVVFHGVLAGIDTANAHIGDRYKEMGTVLVASESGSVLLDTIVPYMPQRQMQKREAVIQRVDKTLRELTQTGNRIELPTLRGICVCEVEIECPSPNSFIELRVVDAHDRVYGKVAKSSTDGTIQIVALVEDKEGEEVKSFLRVEGTEDIKVKTVETRM